MQETILSYIKCIKKNVNLILMLSFFYGSQMIFPVSGPVLKQLVTPKQLQLLSTWGLFCLVLSLLFPPKKLIQNNKKNIFLTIILIITSTLTSLFFFLPTSLKWLVIGLFGFTVGRFVNYWAIIFSKEVKKNQRGQVIGASLFFTYAFLYILNCISPSLNPKIISLIPSIMLIVSLWLYYKHPQNESINNNSIKDTSPKEKIPKYFYFFIILIFLTAGTTYGYIYPILENQYFLNRYYNVIPFIITVPFAGIVADKYARRYLLNIGICFLGLSFIFVNLKISTSSYFLIQNTLQPGWAFIDTYVWVVASDIASMKNKTKYFLYGPAFLVLGTAIGQSFTYILSIFDIEYSLAISLITHFPLFISISLLGKQYSFDYHKKVSYNIVNLNLPNINLLSKREEEVARYLINNYSNKEISECLHISLNTVKTHSTKIYRKLEVSGKKELRKKYFDHLDMF